MRTIDADALKRRAQKVATESWKMKIEAKVETVLNQFIDWIDEAPTIQSEPHWIPCSERLPELGTNVLTLIEPEKECVINHLYDKKEWFYDGVVAWMPLPEEYRGE